VVQALPLLPRVCAAIAESPFSSFRDIGVGRVSGQFGGVPLLPAMLVGTSFQYARLRFGVDLNDVSPEEALKNSRTPLLLIHGTADSNIPIEHSRRLFKMARPGVEFWEVQGGEHVRIRGAYPEEYRRRVREWFGKGPPVETPTVPPASGRR